MKILSFFVELTRKVEICKELADEWKRHGLQEGVQFVTFADVIYQTWSDMTAREYKRFKGLKRRACEIIDQ